MIVQTWAVLDLKKAQQCWSDFLFHGEEPQFTEPPGLRLAPKTPLGFHSDPVQTVRTQFLFRSDEIFRTRLLRGNV